MAPFAPFTAQEAFAATPKGFFASKSYSKKQIETVFELPWFEEEAVEKMNPEFIEQPNRNAAFKAMQELREGIKDHFLSEMLSNEVYKVKSLNQLELVLVVPGHDSKQAKLINVLGSDTSDFFFGCEVTLSTQEELSKRTEKPLKSMKHKHTPELSQEVKMFRSKKGICLRCNKARVATKERFQVCTCCEEILKQN